MKHGARLIAITALVVGATVVAPTTAKAGSSRAVINVNGNNTVVSFNGSVSGLGALQLAASVETVSYGGTGVAVCRINGVGNPAVPGECLGENSGTYWSYWRAAPGAGGFSYSGAGAGATSVTDGHVEGWSFGASAPPFSSFCAVAGCAPPPPPPPPSSPAPAGGTASGGGTASSGAPGGGAPGAVLPGTGQTTDDAGAATTTTPGAMTDPTADEPADRSDNELEQASGPSVSHEGDDDGSPVGVIVASAALAVIGTGATVLRRRRQAPAP